MPNNQNHSAGSARHSARGGARIVGSSRPSQSSAADPELELLGEMRSRDVHPVIQYEYIQELERLDDGN